MSEVKLGDVPVSVLNATDNIIFAEGENIRQYAYGEVKKDILGNETLATTAQTVKGAINENTTQLSEKANYYLEEQLKDDFILAPVFTKKSDGTFKDELFISNNGLDFHKISDYAYGTQFTDHAASVDVSTIFKDGYFYQIYDYKRYDYPSSITSTGYFLGGNGVEIRRTKDFKNYEFWNVDLPTNFLQTWAPEFFVDDNGAIYIVISLSDCQTTAVNSTDGSTQYVKKIYIMSSTDFENWSTPTLINLGLTNVIDPMIYKENGKYYLFVKDEVTGKIKQFSSTSISSGYTLLNTLDSESASIYEGPAVIKYGSGYFLYADAPNVGIAVWYTSNIEQWNNGVITSVSGGELIKHFTPVNINTDTKKLIIQNFIKYIGRNPFLSNNINTSKLCMIRKNYSKLALYPNCTYMVDSSTATTLTISGYTTDLMSNGDKCKFIFNSGQNGGALVLNASSSDYVYFPQAITLSTALKTNNSVVSLEKTPLGIYQSFTDKSSESSVMPSVQTIDLSSNFTTSGNTYVAPTDGWLLLNFNTTGNGQYINIAWQNLGLSIFVNVYQYSGYPCALVPVSKGQTYAVNYNVTSISSAKFIYSKSAL